MRTGFTERPRILDRVETITAFAKEMGEFLHTSEIIETRSFIRSIAKGIAVSPGRAAINYTVPMPEESPIGQSKVAGLELETEVRRIDQRCERGAL